jgi:DNA-binding response OmpR family regulator
MLVYRQRMGRVAGGEVRIHEPSSNVVEVYVGHLQRKLWRDVVETVRGAGYRFLG